MQGMIRNALATVLLLWAAFGNCADGAMIRYFPDSDRLSVQLEQVPIAEVLREIARQTRLDVQLDSRVQDKVSAQVKDLPLDEALTRIAGKLNLVRRYETVAVPAAAGKPATSKRVLVSVSVLPAGEANSAFLRPVIAAADEMPLRAAQSHRDSQRAAASDAARERWQARLKLLPEAQRKVHEAQLAKLAERRADADRQRQQREEERAQRKAASQRNAPETAEARAKRSAPDPALAEKARQQFQQPQTPAVIEDGKR